MSPCSQLLDLWQIDREPSLKAIRDAALALLQAIESHREQTYDAEEIKELDDYAADVSGMTSDLLGNIHGRYLTQADRMGLEGDLLMFDDGGLGAEAGKWRARSDARRPASRFPDVSCSNCGRSFGPGDHGYSHCDRHAGKAGRP